ncbi:MAG: hypothetical protein HYY24_17100 [Verrucomicrobia bacterium]|nr:hypothetical protein [Verrucomicrobiota bacterium]
MKQPFLAYPEKPVPRLAVFSLIVLLALGARAQTPTVTERGPHHRVWQYVTQETDESGAVTEAIHSYTELATGLHYLDGATGQWLESKEEFELVEGAAVARQGQHQVILLANIADDNAVDLLTPDDKRFLSNPRYLSFYDAAANKNVLIAEVKESIGVLVAPNIVLYDDCFDTLKGAIRYTYTRSSFEQDILLYEDPGDPADVGLNPDTTLLEIYTEFGAAPEPRKLKREVASGLEDETLDFDAVQIGSGKAFALLENGLAEEVGVAKGWLALAQRQFLVESAPYLEMKPLLETLPAKPQAKVKGKKERGIQVVRSKVFKGRERLIAGLKPSRTGKAQAKAKTNRPLQVASAKSTEMIARPAVVIDYVTLNTSQSDYLFKGDTTYYVTASVNLNGSNNKLEGGAVIKFASDGTAALNVMGTLTCNTTPYRPAILTAKDDNSAGETISGSTGNPTTTYYANPALYFDGSSSDVKYVRVAHAQKGLKYNFFGTHSVQHAQFVRCERPLLPYYATLNARNVLVHNANTVFDSSSNPMTVNAEHLTVNTASYLAYAGSTGSNVKATNCVFASVTSLSANGNTTFSGQNNGFYSAPNFGSSPVTSTSNPFQSVGKGFHYLASGSNFRNAGSTSLNATLAADLKNRTTYPPIELTTHFTVNTTLNPQAGRDTDTPDLGYHYDPLDYCWTTLNVTNATLTLTNGVAVATYGTKGVSLRTGSSKVISEGTATSFNRLVRYQTVQEQTEVWGTTGSTMSLVELLTSTPQVSFRFTDFSVMADSSNRRLVLANQGSYAVNPISFTHSQIRGVYQSFDDSAVSGTVMSWTNNVLDRCTITWKQSDYYNPFTLYLYNNLFSKGAYTFTTTTYSPAWTVKDNLFDSDSLSKTGTPTFTASNNGYRNGLTSLGGSGNKTIYTMDYQSGSGANWFGALGNFYYPTSGTNLFSLVDAGSRSAPSAGLYHFTVRVDNAKETTGTVDIGYHYVAANGSNQPNDYDGDGLPDYLEDRNGNGSADSGETDWQTSNSGLSGAAALQVFTPLR